MSEHKKPVSKQAVSGADVSYLKRLYLQFLSLPQKKFLFASVVLHGLFFSLLFMHWEDTDPVKPLYIPSNIQAHVVSSEMLQALKEKQEAEQKAIQDKQTHEKKLAEQKRKEQLDKEQALKKAKEEAAKKAAAEKKRAEQEKLKIKKQKDEQEKLEKAKLEKQKAIEQQKKLEDEKKKAAELAKEKQQAEKAREIKEKEKQLLEKLKQMEQQQALALQRAALEAEQLSQQQAFQQYELTEVERFMALIKQRIENLWRIPPKSEGLTITLRIRLLPNGELSSVDVIKSSGSTAFDRSAILAAKSVTRYPVPEDGRVFEKNFRQFSMAFRPETN
jgi:colicin import membrane protein